jgi:hypothetical protein
MTMKKKDRPKKTTPMTMKKKDQPKEKHLMA